MNAIRLLWHTFWFSVARHRRRSHWCDMIAWECVESNHRDQIRLLTKAIPANIERAER